MEHPLKMLKNTQQNIKTKEQEESNRVLFLEQARHLAVHALLTTLTSAQLKLKGRNIEERQATCNSPTSNKKRKPPRHCRPSAEPWHRRHF